MSRSAEPSELFQGESVKNWHRLVGLMLLVILVASFAQAQETTAEAPDQSLQPPSPVGRVTLRVGVGEFTPWVPIGAAPVDQAGSGARGYVLHGEGSEVAAPGSNRFSIHAVAANHFYREQNDEFLVTQRYETHSLALDYRRGFKLEGLPRFEIGGQIQLHQSDSGILNGFILGLETMWASVTGYQNSRNELRTQGAPPQGTVITRNGASMYRDNGTGSGIGDLHGTIKVALLDFEPASRSPRVSLRLGVNLAGSSSFTEGNYLGAGLSLDKKLSEWVAFHGDVRATRALDRLSVWNLPLRSWTFGYSIGPEFRLPKRSSFNVQLDGSSTPFWPTGTLAFDKGYGALTFGLGHRFGPATAQLYFRENMNLPFNVRWNTDPDLSVGLKVRIH
jgi:hypothetical protein